MNLTTFLDTLCARLGLSDEATFDDMIAAASSMRQVVRLGQRAAASTISASRAVASGSAAERAPALMADRRAGSDRMAFSAAVMASTVTAPSCARCGAGPSASCDTSTPPPSSARS